MKGERYLALDGLRGVAAISVALFHAQLAAVHGYLAVDLFFVVSGFVIANSYETRLQSGAISPGDYLRARVWRLYPMLFLGALVGVSVWLLAGSEFHPVNDADFALAVISQFAMIPFLSSAGSYFAFNNPPWSIVWELIVNLAHALGARRLTNRVLVAILVLCAPALVAVSLHFGNLFAGCIEYGAWAALPRAVFGFVLGILLFRTMPRWGPHVPCVSFAVPAMLFLVLVNMPPGWASPGKGWALYDAFVVIFLFGPLVMLTARARGAGVAAALGTLSYPIYVLNEPVVLALNRAGYGTAVLCGALLAMMLVAWAIGKWIDEPLNRWHRRRTRPSASQPQAIPAAATS